MTEGGLRSDAELLDHFRREILPAVRRHEAERAEIAAKLRGPDVLGAVALGLLAAIALRDVDFLGLPVAYVILRHGRDFARRRTGIQRDVIAPLVAFWHPGATYDPLGSVSEDRFRASGLFDGETWTSYRGEDRVSGRLGDTAFTFCELRVTRARKRRSNETIFSGLFFVADAPKHFAGRTVLLPDRSERVLGPFARAFQRLGSVAGGAAVELEDPEFERRFAVWSTDPTEARYLLSPRLMQRLVRFRDNTGAAVRVGFADDSVFVALPLERNLFAVPGVVDEAAVRTWIGELTFATGIVEDLDLNTRVWSKAPAPRRAGTSA